MKYTKEKMQEVVSQCDCFTQVCRTLGVYPAGASWKHIKQKIETYQIDTSHFLGGRVSALRSGKKKLAADVLVFDENTNKRQQSRLLRKFLFEAGVEHCCAECRCPPIWKGKNLILEVDHKNGDWRDSRIENLRFLCPNCHSQTPKYRKYRDGNKCLDCSKKISRKAKRCKDCVKKENAKLGGLEKIKWPATENLIQMVKISSYAEVGRQLGVSDNAVRKRVRNHPC